MESPKTNINKSCSFKTVSVPYAYGTKDISGLALTMTIKLNEFVVCSAIGAIAHLENL
jgi:hypothetical protein